MSVLTFPLPTAAFMDLLPIQAMTFWLPDGLQHSRTAGGEIIPSVVADRLWQGHIMLGKISRAEEALVMSKLKVLGEARGSFLAFDRRKPYPRADASGAVLGASTPTIHTLDADTRQMRLQGLPPGYQLLADDYIGFQFGAASIRAVHSLVSDVAADGAGVTPLFEVVPRLDPGAAVGTAVTLVKAACKALLVPGSLNPGTPSTFYTEGIAFDFIQTLG